ncbi:nudC domain-containing protein 2-like [Macrosteles quadrilineatus]|uniref:nudC domain-containing protein 2-like n=1 Tax=Macrosteles quadrilineatus TaxID=74068 RepID=UPI0023E2F177|nr:nudC domain-containing protein 2-like [Macrosteles quadrilineatus]
MSLSHFDEKSGVVSFKTSWGTWWQTVDEVYISVDLPSNTKAKNVKVTIKTNNVECIVYDKVLFKGHLYKPIHPDDSVWTIEDGCTLNIVLSKAEYDQKDTLWESILKDGSYQPDPLTLHEMRKKLDLEKFQIENPGMDFSRAKLSKSYDQMPGMSVQRNEDTTTKN